MLVERRVNSSTGKVELWRCQWENLPGSKPHKVYIAKICDEQAAAMASQTVLTETSAICWSWGRTLGNIAVQSESLVGRFPDKAGNDAQLPCNLVNAGKFRHGADRWWCQTHQTHWGTKGDLHSFANTGELRCANHDQRMSYVVRPLTIALQDYDEVGLWCSMPAAISTELITPRRPRLHLHVRPQKDGDKTVDRDLEAISIVYNDNMDLFGSKDISLVNVTPPAAYEFVCGLESKREMSCINCSHCGFPHLDLGDFARKPHRKHFCGHCGRDSTVSRKPISSTPLYPLHERFAKNVTYKTPDATLDLDNYRDCTYTIWASTPAIVWTANRPQEFGLHVHVHRGVKRIIDDTFGSVTLNGTKLARASLLSLMIVHSLV